MAKSELITAPKTLDATPGQQVEMREKNMNDKLRSVSDEWLDIRVRELTEDIKIYWQMANQVREIVSNPEVYGHDAAKMLLSRHDMDTASVKEFLAVSQTLDQDFVDKMVAYNQSPAARFGLVTATHMRLLVKQPSAAERRKLWDRIKKEKLSVRDTIARIRANKDDGAEGLDDRVKKRVVALLGKTVKSATSLCDNIELVSEDTFLEAIQNVKEEDLSAAVKNCNEALSRMQAICEAGQAGLMTLENIRERLVQRYDQAAAKAASLGREMKERKTTNKRKIARDAALADDNYDDDDSDVVEGIVTTKKVSPVKPAAKPEKTAVYKNPKKRLQAEAAAKVTESSPAGDDVEAPVAKPKLVAAKAGKVNRLRRPKAST